MKKRNKGGKSPNNRPVAQSAATAAKPKQKTEVELLLENIQQSPSTETAPMEAEPPLAATAPPRPVEITPDAPSILAEPPKQENANKEVITWGREAFKSIFNKNGHEALAPFAEKIISELDANKTACCELCQQNIRPFEYEIGSDVVIVTLLLYYLKMQRDSFALATAADITSMLSDVFGIPPTEPSISPSNVEAMMKFAFAIGAITKTKPDEANPIMAYAIFENGIQFVNLERKPLVHWLVYNNEILGFADKGKEHLGHFFSDMVNNTYGNASIGDKQVDAYTYFKTMAYNAVKKFCETTQPAIT